MSLPPASEAAAILEALADLRKHINAMRGTVWDGHAESADESFLIVREYIAALEARLAEAERALREIAGYYAGCRSRDTGKSICANRALAALPPESEAQECEACGEPVTEAEIAAGLWCYGHGEHGPPPALPPESAEEWSEYHEFRKRTDPPPWGQGLDE